MNYSNEFRVKPGSKVDLGKISAGFKDQHESHEHALPEIEAYDQKLHDLQYLMYAEGKRSRTRFLPDNISDAIRLFKASRFVGDILGEDSHTKYVELKQMSADRCPRALGDRVKRGEVMFHHEVTNQMLWSMF